MWQQLVFGRRDQLIGMELTLDNGKKLQSLPKQSTNVPSIVSKVNVVVLAVPSFAHGQFFKAWNHRCCDAGEFGWRHPLLSVLGEKARDIVFVGCETFGGRAVSLSGAVAPRFSARRRTSWRP